VMTKRRNRVAWALVAVLSAVLSGGIGALLTQGITVGSYSAWLRPTREWAVGRGLGLFSHGSISQRYHLGFITLHTTRPDPSFPHAR
jgi:hypothetical protein